MTKNGGRAGAAAEGLQCLTCCPAQQVRRPKAADVVLLLLAACQKKPHSPQPNPIVKDGRGGGLGCLKRCFLTEQERKQNVDSQAPLALKMDAVRLLVACI